MLSIGGCRTSSQQPTPGCDMLKTTKGSLNGKSTWHQKSATKHWRKARRWRTKAAGSVQRKEGIGLAAQQVRALEPALG